MYREPQDMPSAGDHPTRAEGKAFVLRHDGAGGYQLVCAPTGQAFPVTYRKATVYKREPGYKTESSWSGPIGALFDRIIPRLSFIRSILDPLEEDLQSRPDSHELGYGDKTYCSEFQTTTYRCRISAKVEVECIFENWELVRVRVRHADSGRSPALAAAESLLQHVLESIHELKEQCGVKAMASKYLVAEQWFRKEHIFLPNEVPDDAVLVMSPMDLGRTYTEVENVSWLLADLSIDGTHEALLLFFASYSEAFNRGEFWIVGSGACRQSPEEEIKSRFLSIIILSSASSRGQCTLCLDKQGQWSVQDPCDPPTTRLNEHALEIGTAEKVQSGDLIYLDDVSLKVRSIRHGQWIRRPLSDALWAEKVHKGPSIVGSLKARASLSKLQ